MVSGGRLLVAVGGAATLRQRRSAGREPLVDLQRYLVEKHWFTEKHSETPIFGKDINIGTRLANFTGKYLRRKTITIGEYSAKRNYEEETGQAGRAFEM